MKRDVHYSRGRESKHLDGLDEDVDGQRGVLRERGGCKGAKTCMKCLHGRRSEALTVRGCATPPLTCVAYRLRVARVMPMLSRSCSQRSSTSNAAVRGSLQRREEKRGGSMRKRTRDVVQC